MDEQIPEMEPTDLAELEAVGRELHGLGDADVPRDVATRLAARLAAERAQTPLGAARRRRRSPLRVATIAGGIAAAAVVAVFVLSQLGGGATKPPAAARESSVLASGAAKTGSTAQDATVAPGRTATPKPCLKPKKKPPCRTKRCRIVRKKAAKARRLACRRARDAIAQAG